MFFRPLDEALKHCSLVHKPFSLITGLISPRLLRNVPVEDYQWHVSSKTPRKITIILAESHSFFLLFLTRFRKDHREISLDQWQSISISPVALCMPGLFLSEVKNKNLNGWHLFQPICLFQKKRSSPSMGIAGISKSSSR